MMMAVSRQTIMFLALAVCYLSKQAVQALPVFTADDLHTPLSQRRTIWDIVRSCLATIFLCTWVAVHAGIPQIEHGDYAKPIWYMQRLFLTLIALLAPEALIAFAVMEFFQARQISKKHEGVFIFPIHSKCLLKCISRVWMDNHSWVFCPDGRLRVVRR